MQPSEVEVFREAERTILGKISLKNENARKYEMAFRGSLANIDAATKAYMDTGVGVVDRLLLFDFKRADIKPKGYFQKLASAIGRPFVYVEEPHHMRSHIQITKSARAENLAAAFLLNAVDYPSPYRAEGHTGSPISKCDGEGYWRFYLHGQEGRELVRLFLESCRTNPVNRIILKLPPR